jgi:modification methylase
MVTRNSDTENTRSCGKGNFIMPTWKIIQGDCLQVMETMSENSVQCVVTSPPYNLHNKKFHDSYRLGRVFGEKHNHWYKDGIPEDEYKLWQHKCVAEMMRVCRGTVCYNHKVRYGASRQGEVIHPMDWLRGFPCAPFWTEIIWDRCSGTNFNCGRFINTDERIFMFKKPVVFHKECAAWGTVWTIPPQPNINNHPCPFPVEIPKRCITALTNEGDTILDPFCGSASTGVAALQTGRNFIGIEISPDYCAMARRRLQNETGLIAKEST